jgi:hypothetical protein
MNGKCISGAIENGITNIIVTYKKDQCHVYFGSMDNSGLLAYTWYTSDIEIGDSLNICFEDIIHISEAREIRNYNRTLEKSQKEDLETYRKLKKELIEKGVI